MVRRGGGHIYCVGVPWNVIVLMELMVGLRAVLSRKKLK